jgi:hypothetical protein
MFGHGQNYHVVEFVVPCKFRRVRTLDSDGGNIMRYKVHAAVHAQMLATFECEKRTYNGFEAVKPKRRRQRLNNLRTYLQAANRRPVPSMDPEQLTRGESSMSSFQRSDLAAIPKHDFGQMQTAIASNGT